MSKLRANPWATLIVLSLGFFLTLLDLTIVNIAIPSITRTLHASLPQVLWAMNSYIIALTALLITAGRLGDMRGPRQLFALGVGIFTVASLLCGLAATPEMLVAARVLQGIGAALLLPQTMTLIVSSFPAERRGTALGVWGAIAGVASIIGPTLGGFLVSTVGWRWIFFMNIPIGAVVLIATALIIPDLRTGKSQRLDLLGVVIASVALVCLAFALINGQDFHWNATIWLTLAAAVVLGVVFCFQQRGRQSRDPLVPFALFRNRNYTLLNGVSASTTGGIFGLTLLASLYFQSVLGFSAFKAGLILVPASVMSVLLAPFTGRLADRIEGKYILLTGMVLTAVGMLWAALLMSGDTSWAAFMAPMVVVGTGNGFVIAPLATVAMRDVEPALVGAASGTLNTMRQLGSVICSAGVGALVQSRQAATGSASTAMQTTMALPIAVIVLGALACLAMRKRAAAPVVVTGRPAAAVPESSGQQ